jgi:hypothetical protein
VIEKVSPNTPNYRLEREDLWIKRLSTKTPHGLNKQDWHSLPKKEKRLCCYVFCNLLVVTYICYLLLVTCYLLLVTCYLLLVTCYLLHACLLPVKNLLISQLITF